jgi:hypothetical protein
MLRVSYDIARIFLVSEEEASLQDFVVILAHKYMSELC